MTWTPSRSCSARPSSCSGLAYAIARWTWIDADGGWVLGAFLVALGVAGVVSATTRHRRGGRRRLPGPEATGVSLGVGADRFRPGPSTWSCPFASVVVTTTVAGWRLPVDASMVT